MPVRLDQADLTPMPTVGPVRGVRLNIADLVPVPAATTTTPAKGIRLNQADLTPITPAQLGQRFPEVQDFTHLGKVAAGWQGGTAKPEPVATPTGPVFSAADLDKLQVGLPADFDPNREKPLSTTPAEAEKPGWVRRNWDAFKQGLAQNPEKYIPIGGTVFEVQNLLDVMDAAKRLEQDKLAGIEPGKSPYQDETEGRLRIPSSMAAGMWGGGFAVPKRPAPMTADQQRQRDVKLLQAFDADRKKAAELGQSFGGVVGQILGEMPGYMVDIGLTGGIYGGIKKATERGLTRALLTKAGEEGLTKGLERGAVRTAIRKGVVPLAGWTAGGLAQGTALPQRTAEEYLKRTVPEQFSFDEQGQPHFQWPDEKPATRFLKAWGDTVVQTASEQAGEGIKDVSKAVLSRLPFGGKLMEKLFTRYAQLHPETSYDQFTKKMANRVAFNGMLGEVGEEYLGDSLEAIVGINDYGQGKDAGPLQRLEGALWQDIKATPAMLVSFAVPGAAQRLPGMLARAAGVGRQQTPEPERPANAPPYQQEQRLAADGGRVVPEGQLSVDLPTENLPIVEPKESLPSENPVPASESQAKLATTKTANVTAGTPGGSIQEATNEQRLTGVPSVAAPAAPATAKGQPSGGQPAIPAPGSDAFEEARRQIAQDNDLEISDEDVGAELQKQGGVEGGVENGISSTPSTAKKPASAPITQIPAPQNEKSSTTKTGVETGVETTPTIGPETPIKSVPSQETAAPQDLSQTPTAVSDKKGVPTGQEVQGQTQGKVESTGGTATPVQPPTWDSAVQLGNTVTIFGKRKGDEQPRRTTGEVVKIFKNAVDLKTDQGVFIRVFRTRAKVEEVTAATRQKAKPGQQFTPTAEQKARGYQAISLSKTDRTATNAEKAIDNNMLVRARELLTEKGDDYNLTLIKGMKVGNLSPADRDSLSIYVFGTEEGGRPEDIPNARPPEETIPSVQNRPQIPTSTDVSTQAPSATPAQQEAGETPAPAANGATVAQQPALAANGGGAEKGVIARTKPQPSASEDGVEWYREYRLRKLSTDESDALYRELGPSYNLGTKYLLEERKVKVKDGQTTPDPWERWNWGTSRQDAVEGAIGDTAFNEAESLSPIHSKAVEKARQEQEKDRREYEAEKARKAAEERVSELKWEARKDFAAKVKAAEKRKGGDLTDDERKKIYDRAVEKWISIVEAAQAEAEGSVQTTNQDLASAIAARDFDQLKSLLEAKEGNEANRAAFTRQTGVALPDSVAGTENTIGEWVAGRKPSSGGRMASPGSRVQSTDIDRGRLQVSMEPKNKPVSAREILTYVQRAFAVPMKGKATHKMVMAAGWFDAKAVGIRLKDQRAISTAIHEIGHYIDWTLNERWSLKPPSKNISDELMALGKALYGTRQPSGGYKSEGWAEFVREYITGEEAETKAPNLYRFFVNEYLPGNPEVAQKIATAKRMIADFRFQGAEARVESQINRTALHGTIKERAVAALQWANTVFRDELAVFKRVTTATGKDLRPSENPYELAVAFADKAGSKARQFVLSGTTDLAGNIRGPSLREALEDIQRKDFKTFTRWIYAKEALFRWSQGKNPGISKADAQYVYDKYKTPEWEAAADAVTKWNREVLDYLVDAGGFDPKVRDMLSDTPIYIPLFRALAKEDTRPMGSGTGRGLQAGKPVKKMKGSGRETIDPFESMIQQCERFISVAHKSMVAKSLAAFADVPGMAGWIWKVPAPQQAVKFTSEKIKNDIRRIAVERLGLDPDEIPADFNEPWDDMLTIWQNASQYYGKDNIVSLFVDGKKQWFEVHPDLYKAIEGLDQYMLPWYLSIFGKAARAVRLGATGLNAAFGLVRNFLRDAGMFTVTAKHARLGPLSAISGVVSDIANTEGARRFKALGGEMAGQILNDRIATQRLRDELTGGWVIHTVKHPIEALRELFGIMELGPRIAEFEKALDVGAQKYGKGTLDASLYALNAAQDVTTNFTRHGQLGKVLNQLIPFFNAAIQGPDKVVRTFAERPGRTAALALASLTLPAIILWWLAKDEDWYKHLSPQEKANYLHFRVPGTKRVVRIPIPFELGYIFQSIPVAVLDQQYQGDKGKVKDVLKIAADRSNPLAWPAAIGPAIDVMTNKSWSGTPIVSEAMKNKLPEDRTRPYTTSLMKFLGKELGVAPVQLEYLVDAYSGGLYSRIARTGDLVVGFGNDKTLSDVPIIGTLFARETERPTEKLDQFYQRLDLLNQKAGSKKITAGEMLERTQFMRLSRSLSDSRKALEKPGVSVDEKATIYRDMDKELTRVLAIQDSGPSSGDLLSAIASLTYGPGNRDALTGASHPVGNPHKGKEADVQALREAWEKAAGRKLTLSDVIERQMLDAAQKRQENIAKRNAALEQGQLLPPAPPSMWE